MRDIGPFKQRLEQIKAEDLSQNTQLGRQNGFHEVNDIKNDYSVKLLALISEMEIVSNYLPRQFVERELEKIEGFITSIESFKRDIDSIVKSPTNHPNFINIRNRVHETAKNLANKFGNEFFELELSIQNARSAKRLDNLNPEAITDKIAKQSTELNDAIDRANKIIKTLQDSSIEKSYQKSQSSYIDLAETHSTREWCWFWACVASVIALFSAVAYIIWGNYTAGTLPDTILLIIRKAFMVSAPLLVLKIALTKYNAERHLHILYDHRNAAIDQLRLLEASIDDDKNAKAELRLEAAKMILSDPTSSYGSSHEASEININPVFTALEKISGKSD